MTSTLTDFLLTRIAEDWADASDNPTYRAECKARQQVVMVVQRWIDAGYPTLDRVLFALALPYADHPDYDEAWRP